MRLGKQRRPPAERFMGKIEVPADHDACWIWKGSTRGTGYGKLCIERGTLIYAHRFAYELFVGPIPDGLTIDHLCRNKACVNPHHLEPVTMRENIIRNVPHRSTSTSPACRNGHLWTPETTAQAKGARRCRVCHREGEIRRRLLRYAAEGIA